MKTVLRELLIRVMLALGAAGLVIGLALAVTGGSASAQEDEPPPSPPPLHPTFPLLDENGNNVLETGLPVSTMQTCGGCHDTAFIADHSGHAMVGMDTLPNETSREWDTTSGWFGEWNPIVYRYLSPADDERIDLTTAEWIQVYGWRHVGGGPAVTSREGHIITDLAGDQITVETGIVDAESGELMPWDWSQSGMVEMNCFLCHMNQPNNASRIEALEAGNFAWASSATLEGSGIIERVGDGWQWNTDAFDDEGELLPGYVSVADPIDDNCGQCHGLTHADAQAPLTIDVCNLSDWTTLTTGLIYTPQQMMTSGVNLEDKQNLRRTWDVHAERVVGCVDCHYSLNNPIFFVESENTRPDHLTFDPRRMDFGDYLEQPLHQFANSPHSDALGTFDLANRTCVSCHDAQSTHDWLPYVDGHMAALACESCHIPEVKGPALEYIDWTSVDAAGAPVRSLRGTDVCDDLTLITGYEPVLLPQENADGSVKLAPYNLVTAWYWIYGDPARPVPLRDLMAAWLDGDTYHPDVLAAFDINGDGDLSDGERLINSDEKEAVITERLTALGLENPRIQGEVDTYALHHNVTHGEWATRDCATCHSEDSRLRAAFALSDRTPGGVEPQLIGGQRETLNGELFTDRDGTLFYRPTYSEAPTELYVLGSSRVEWVDWVGILAFVGVLLGVGAHGTLRYLSARRAPTPHEPEIREVYMYSIYERQWHWLQTIAILGLLFTGLVIHRPDAFRMFDFRAVVLIHNALALILVVNAALAAFYHLASGEIRQYLPEPKGFFGQMFAQAKYYLWGIFNGAPHPFEKTPNRKLNPLQQLTYLAILNVLLPLQVITGALMWGEQQWPDISAALGGLPFLAPLHALTAWFFAAFIVMHVYLTTTGHTPLANIRAMMLGWDEVEVHGTTGDAGHGPAPAAPSEATQGGSE